MEHLVYVKENYMISTDPALIDVNYVHHYLATESYWAQNIPLATVQKAIAHSLNFGVYLNQQQVGFARIVTDYACFGYLCDVFIDQTQRGKGLSKWLMQVITDHPLLQGFRGWFLGTKDAHGLYAQFGWTAHPEPHRIMRKSNLDVYKASAG